MEMTPRTMAAEREIGGVLYRCGNSLLSPAWRCSGACRFAFAKSANPDELTALVKDLAYLCRRASDDAKPEPADMRELLELAFFALGVNYGDVFPVLPARLFRDAGEEGRLEAA